MSFGGQKKENREAGGEHPAVLWIIVVALLCFVIYFACKMEGAWDVSRNYNIRRITASRDKGNVQAVIDGREETVWGSGNYWEKGKAGDYIRFVFDEPDSFAGVEIQGTFPDELEFFCRQDGEWIPVETTEKQEGVFLFAQPVETEQIKILTGDGAERKKWKVKEIVFYEEQ